MPSGNPNMGENQTHGTGGTASSSGSSGPAGASSSGSKGPSGASSSGSKGPSGASSSGSKGPSGASSSSGGSGSPGGSQNQGGGKMGSGSSQSGGVKGGTGGSPGGSQNQGGGKMGAGSSQSGGVKGGTGGSSKPGGTNAASGKGSANAATGPSNYGGGKSFGAPGGAASGAPGVKGSGSAFGGFGNPGGLSPKDANSLSQLNKTDRAIVDTASALAGRYGKYGMSVPDAYQAATEYAKTAFGELGTPFSTPKNIAAVSQVMMNRLDAAYMNGQYGGSWKSALQGFDASPEAAQRKGSGLSPKGNSAYGAAGIGTDAMNAGLGGLLGQLQGTGPSLPDRVMNATNYATPKADAWNGFGYGPHNFSNPDPGRPGSKIASNRAAISDGIGALASTSAPTSPMAGQDTINHRVAGLMSDYGIQHTSPAGKMASAGAGSIMAGMGGLPGKMINDRIAPEKEISDRITPTDSWTNSSYPGLSPRGFAEISSKKSTDRLGPEPNTSPAMAGLGGFAPMGGVAGITNSIAGKPNPSGYSIGPAAAGKPNPSGYSVGPGPQSYDPLGSVAPARAPSLPSYDPLSSVRTPAARTPGIFDYDPLSSMRTPFAAPRPGYDPLSSVRTPAPPQVAQNYDPLSSINLPASRTGPVQVAQGYDPLSSISTPERVGPREALPAEDTPEPQTGLGLLAWAKSAIPGLQTAVDTVTPYAELVKENIDNPLLGVASWLSGLGTGNVTKDNPSRNQAAVDRQFSGGNGGSRQVAYPTSDTSVFTPMGYQLGPANYVVPSQNGIVNSDYSGIGGTIPYV